MKSLIHAIIWLILTIVGVFVLDKVHYRIEKNCNMSGGSYLGGHCIHFNSK